MKRARKLALLALVMGILAGVGSRGSAEAADSFRLTVTPMGSGMGSVTSGTDIACNYDGSTPTGTCEHDFDAGEVVTLVAEPDVSSTFTGWAGEGCEDTGTCQVTLNTARSVAATFTARPDATIQRSKDGSAAVGDGAYSPSEQVATSSVKAGKTRSFSVTITNKSPSADVIGVSAACSGEDFGFASTSEPDIFAAPVSAPIDPNETMTFDVIVSAGKRARGTATCVIDARSSADASALDTVIARVRVASARRDPSPVCAASVQSGSCPSRFRGSDPV